MKKIGLAVMVLLCFAGCRKAEVPSYQTAAEAKTLLDVSYGLNSQQTMDVYLPAYRTTNTNVIIFVHGGSFIGGDKNYFDRQANYLRSRGNAVFNINYRLVDGTGIFDSPPVHLESGIKVKDQVDDVSAVVDYVISNAKRLVFSKDKIGIAGHSAGGTLALLYSYDLRNTTKVKVASNIAGALDMDFTNVAGWQLYPAYVFEGGFRYTGYQINPANEQYYKMISPLYTANTGRQVPTLNIFPQNNDLLGLPKQDFTTYSTFSTKLDELKIPNELFFVAEADHNFSRPGDWQLVLDKTLTYFNKIFKN